MVTIKQQELEKRRNDFYSLMARGTPLQEAVKTISKEYGVSPKTIYGDWRQRELWGVVDEHDTTQALNDCLFRLNELRRELWRIVNDNGEVAATLKAISKLVDLELNILKGLVKAEPVQLELVNKEDVKVRAERLEAAIVAAADGDKEFEERMARCLYEYATGESEN